MHYVTVPYVYITLDTLGRRNWLKCNAVITTAIRLRYDYDPTMTYRAPLLPFDAIRREQKMNMLIFRRSRVVVVS